MIDQQRRYPASPLSENLSIALRVPGAEVAVIGCGLRFEQLLLFAGVIGLLVAQGACGCPLTALARVLGANAFRGPEKRVSKTCRRGC